LFDRDKITWEGRAPHDRVVMHPGTKVGKLKGDLLHYTVKTPGEHDAQIEKFSSIRAKLLYAEGKRPDFYHLHIKPPLKFFIDYFLKLGFLDGYPGFLIAWKSSRGHRKRYVKLKQMYGAGTYGAG
jgi:hypothetical protein